MLDHNLYIEICILNELSVLRINLHLYTFLHSSVSENSVSFEDVDNKSNASIIPVNKRWNPRKPMQKKPIHSKPIVN